MANEIAIRLHCAPGDELLAAEDCHLFFAEAAGPARDRLISVGRYALRGVRRPEELFTLLSRLEPVAGGSS